MRSPRYKPQYAELWVWNADRNDPPANGASAQQLGIHSTESIAPNCIATDLTLAPGAANAHAVVMPAIASISLRRRALCVTAASPRARRNRIPPCLDACVLHGPPPKRLRVSDPPGYMLLL